MSSRLKRDVLHLDGRSPDRSSSECVLDEAIEFWEGRLGRKLSREDARQIIENLTGFFRVLDRWQNPNHATVTAVESHGEEQGT